MNLPGATAFSPQLTQKLTQALKAKGSNYVPRTHHLHQGQPKFINRLILETSPYLLQHAHNPVNWFPWGEEAFALAKKLDRPILMSIGYSTCHWCHVMEKESFEDEEISAYINAHYVAIKVDREERPDVDSVYMTAVQMMTGRGGWPMTIVMTPEKLPFFGGTYFPARDGDRGSRMGFLSILRKLQESYKGERAEVVSQSQRLSQAIQRASQRPIPKDMPSETALGRAAHLLASRFDPLEGGFGHAPKFPRPSTYGLLLRYARRTQDGQALKLVTHSLTKMSRGGIYDHVAGGFARYSTDRNWLVPHFEKMLYDNAQLAELLVELWQSTQDEYFREVTEHTLDYVLKEMRSAEGGFYSATDADSEGEEGKFFVWTPKQLKAALSPAETKFIQQVMGVTERGNFEGHNIFFRSASDAEDAQKLGLETPAFKAQLSSILAKLYIVRERREHPLLDDKVLTEWNGQMISALAKAGFAFDKQKYLDAAEQAAAMLLEKLSQKGRLLRAYRQDQAKHAGVLEDYAFFIAGLLDLFEATQQSRWLNEAQRLQKLQDQLFFDSNGGGYFSTASDAEQLLVREKTIYDGAQPSGNSVSALNLLRLHEFTEDKAFFENAQRTLLAYADSLEKGAGECPKLAQALDYYLDEAKELVLVQHPNDDGKALQEVFREAFLPNRALVIATEAEVEKLALSIPWIAGKKALKGKATAYVCIKGLCKRPTSDPQELKKQLREFKGLAAKPLQLPKP